MPRKARRRAWGSVTEVTRGKKYVLRWVENTPQGRKRKSRTVRGTYREACNELARIQVEKADERPVPTIGQTYEMWYLPWLIRKWPDPGHNTRKSYESNWRNHCEPKWGGMPVDKVSPLEVQAWLNGLTTRTAETALIVMKKVMGFAENYEVVPDNKFAKQYEMPKNGKKLSRDTYTLPQAVEKLAELRDTELEAPFILACFGSCRTSESTAVRTDEVRAATSHGLVFALAEVRRQAPHAGWRPVEYTKTDESSRTIVIPPPYSTRLLEIARTRADAGIEWIADRGDGLPINNGRLKNLWSRIGEIPFSNLRPSWRTFAAYDWKVPWDTLEICMGHKLKGTTGRHYLRPTTEMLLDAFAEAYVENGIDLG